ncbi:MAG TPA: HD-GYP domain-containing protein [Acidimicrobiia bacterium]|nr:HD-GYP domain-containing protein [Acidimicrobiia bacterium]
MAASRDDRWVARPLVAGVIRLLVVVTPAVAGALASWQASRLWEQPSGFGRTVLWFIALVAVAVVVVLVVQRFARRFLPLAWLFSITMAFPDKTPSRMVTARRAASRRARRKALEQIQRDGRMGHDAYEASEAALVLVAALGAHDKRTRGHSERVRTLADLLAKEAGLSDAERDKLRWGALLHDIGKLAVPGAILNKPDRPSEEEWATLQRHPEEGAHLVEPLVIWLGPWAGAVGHHHEKWDGSGYPQGLAGEDISLGGRILAIADAYEVMTATRAYKVPMSTAAARKELVASAGTHFDPALVRAFMGISLGALWWTTGVAALLAQIPLLGKVGAAPGFARLRSGLSGSATAVATVAALVVAGVVGDGSGEPAVSRAQSTQSAAPAPVPTPSSSSAPVASGAAAGSPATTAPGAFPSTAGRPVSGPASTRPVPSLDSLLEGVGTAITTPTETPTETPTRVLPVAPPAPASPAGGPGAEAPPKTFTAKGQLLAPDLLGRLGIGLTNRGPVGGCGPSPGQGLDAWVFELPADGPGAGARVTATGSDLLGLHNLAAVFVDADCNVLGQLDTPAADEAGVLPAGTRFVVVSDRLGVGTAVTLTVG